jgi:hypothetical protein
MLGIIPQTKERDEKQYRDRDYSSDEVVSKRVCFKVRYEFAHAFFYAEGMSSKFRLKKYLIGIKMTKHQVIYIFELRGYCHPE